MGGIETLALGGPKAITTSIAIVVAREIGGLPALTADLGTLDGIEAAILSELILCRTGRGPTGAGACCGRCRKAVAAAQISKRDPLAVVFSELRIGLTSM